MKFGTKLKLKKDLQRGYITFQKGDILNVAHYDHKYGLTLCHPQVRGIIAFDYSPHNKEALINEFFEVVDDKGLLDIYTRLLNHIDDEEIASHIQHVVSSSEQVLKFKGLEKWTK